MHGPVIRHYVTYLFLGCRILACYKPYWPLKARERGLSTGHQDLRLLCCNLSCVLIHIGVSWAVYRYSVHCSASADSAWPSLTVERARSDVTLEAAYP